MANEMKEFWESKFDSLVKYNAQKTQGITHTTQYAEEMKILQDAYDAKLLGCGMGDNAMGFTWIETGIIAVIALILVAVGVGAYVDHKRPTIEIKKDDWECIKSEKRTRLQPMMTGKVTFMQPMTKTVCVEYRRHAG